MSALRFSKPLLIKGLPPEAESEWNGLHVGLATAFGLGIGTIEEPSARIWDKDMEVWRCDGPFPHDPAKHSLEINNSYMWISRNALIDACKYSQPKRPHILEWLENGDGQTFSHFRISEDVAEYLP